MIDHFQLLAEGHYDQLYDDARRHGAGGLNGDAVLFLLGCRAELDEFEREFEGDAMAFSMQATIRKHRFLSGLVAILEQQTGEWKHL